MTADPRTKVYGAADPALTYQITGGALVGSDSLSGTLSRVRIPPTLRSEVAGAREVEASGGTVRELLDDLLGRFPSLRGQLLEDEDLAPFVNVYVEGEDVRTKDGLETPVDDGSTVILLPAMAGG